MHISAQHISMVVPGDLALPPLENTVGDPKDKRFCEEINSSGAYIHKLSRHPGSLREQFEKIHANKIPTPATFVGTGSFHRTYNRDRWAGTSGLVFSPDTFSMISFKGDIGSVRLSNIKKNFSDFTHRNLQLRRIEYASYLSSEFNKLSETATAFNNRKPKKLRLVEDMQYASEKYRELEQRSNLAFERHRLDKDFRPRYEDRSSKYIIHKSIANLGKRIDEWTKAGLLGELEKLASQDAEFGVRIMHAVRKIRRFDGDHSVQNYLRKGALEPEKTGHYTNIAKEWGAQTANEHLVMPSYANIIGVCVNVERVDGIDQALELNATLKEIRCKLGVIKKDPALIYHLSPKKNQCITHVGWSQCIVPWTSKGLIEFAKTGQVEDLDGAKFKPNHFKLIHTLADSSSLVMFEDHRTLHGCKFEKNFVDDLSSVKENKSNLLHLAIENGRDLETIKFFYFWRVDPFSEKNDAGVTAMDLARQKHRPAESFLDSIRASAQSSAINTLIRNEYIADRLAEVRDSFKDFRGEYSLRTGETEKGLVKFIPELGTYRVTNGLHSYKSVNEQTEEGIRKFDPASGNTRLSIGVVVRRSADAESKIFVIDGDANDRKQIPSLGRVCQIQDFLFGSSEKISYLCQLPTHLAYLEIKPSSMTLHRSRFDLSGGVAKTFINRQIAADRSRCTYFQTAVYLPNSIARSLTAPPSAGWFPHLGIIEGNFDRSEAPELRFSNLMKYASASLRYLRGCKESVDHLNQEEQMFLTENGPEFVATTDRLAKKQWDMFHQTFSQHASLLMPGFEKADSEGECFLQYVADEYLLQGRPECAEMQYLVGKRMELRNGARIKDLVVARKLYEQAAQHQHGEAEFALSRFFNLGIGGLREDKARAQSLVRDAASHGVADAKMVKKEGLAALERFAK